MRALVLTFNRQIGLDSRIRFAGPDFAFQAAGEFNGFWMHQCVRAGLLRQVFRGTSRPSYSIREVHERFMPSGDRAARVDDSLRGTLQTRPAADVPLADLETEACVVPHYPVVAGSAVYNDQGRGWR